MLELLKSLVFAVNHGACRDGHHPGSGNFTVLVKYSTSFLVLVEKDQPGQNH